MGWYQVLSIYREAAQQKLDEETRPPVACPNDGTVLDLGPDGILFCRWGCDYRWPM